MEWWLAGLAAAGLIFLLLRRGGLARAGLARLRPADAPAAPERDIADARARIGTVMNGHNVTQISVAELCDMLGLPRPDVGPLKEARSRQLGVLLDGIDVGFEPDPRYGAPAPAGGGRVMLFRAEAGAPVESGSALYVAARALAEAAALAAGDTPDRASYVAVSGALKRMDGLGTPERMRLLAALGALFADPPPRPAVEARLAGLPQEARGQVGRAVAAIVAAEAQAASAHARFLDRLCQAFDLPAAGRLRAIGVAGGPQAPVTVVPPPGPLPPTQEGPDAPVRRSA